MAKHTLPSVLFLSPVGAAGAKHKIRHTHVMFHVEEYDDQGRPKTLRLLPDNDKKYQIDGGECFITGYVQTRTLEPDEHRKNLKSPPLKEA